ncbi:uncharacterized protein LOC119078348 [Bradysia coprophila]|uniref:uncharacterized protein LOC119078348 n=1 Tax=Bradysia coprophila TaxID=38358 RepID=UPI00187DD234|nr:uncharacterized protein LOC119078348 [Bradysia coprophila]
MVLEMVIKMRKVCDNYNSQPISTSMSTPINEANVMHVTGDNGFSIYERSIDFHANFGGDQNVATTKDTATRPVSSQIEPNLLLKNVNNNNHVTSTAAAREIENIDDIPAVKGKLDDDDKSTPDHHARRPMNAFLIFCKRHRAIVREKYPNLENRMLQSLSRWYFVSQT